METRIDARAACDEVVGVAEAIATLSPGDVVYQGTATSLASRPSRLAGTRSGRGSWRPGRAGAARHFAEGDDDVLRVPDAVAIPVLHHVAPGIDNRQLVGPIIRARCPLTLTHPEYAGPNPARRRVLPGGLSVSLEY